MSVNTIQPRGKLVDNTRLILVDVEGNSNKVWFAELYDSGDLKVEWGAVDTRLQGKTHVGAGASKLESLKRSKLKKGYTEQRTIANGVTKTTTVAKQSLRDVAQQQIKYKNPNVSQLISFLTQANVHAIIENTQMTYDVQTGSFSTPYGLVEAGAIVEARQYLGTIGDCVNKRDWDSPAILRSVGDYLRLIPQRVARDNRRRRLDIKSFVPDLVAVRKQNDLLDMLDASLQQARVPVSDGKKAEGEKVFDVQLDLVEDGKIFDQVKRKYESSKGGHYDVSHLGVKQVFRVKIKTMHDAFEKHGRKVGNVKQLFHGSSTSHLLSILKSGLLIIPSSSPHVTGRLFLDGVYTSSNATKSLRYSTGGWGGMTSSRVFLFLCRVAMGKPYTPVGYATFKGLPPGYDSCWAKPQISGVQNDEQIVYNTNQVDLIYLLEFSRGGK